MTHTPATPLTGNAPIPLTAEELAEIERRANEATPGPWRVVEAAGRTASLHRARVESRAYDDEEPGICGDYNRHWPLVFGDAEFIAHARTDIPALLSTLRARESEIERLRGVIECALEAAESAEQSAERGDLAGWEVNVIVRRLREEHTFASATRTAAGGETPAE